MPSTKKQQRTAGMELQLRRDGIVVQQPNRQRATRPMGSMSTENLRKYAQGIDKEIDKLELLYSKEPTAEHKQWLAKARKQKREGW